MTRLILCAVLLLIGILIGLDTCQGSIDPWITQDWYEFGKPPEFWLFVTAWFWGTLCIYLIYPKMVKMWRGQ